MMASLEWGLFEYARSVLDNWLRYFVEVLPPVCMMLTWGSEQERGFVLYRGLEMAQQGRMLTNIAQYYLYTGEPRSDGWCEMAACRRCFHAGAPPIQD